MVKGDGNKMILNAETIALAVQKWLRDKTFETPIVEKVTHDNRTGLFHVHFKDTSKPERKP